MLSMESLKPWSETHIIIHTSNFRFAERYINSETLKILGSLDLITSRPWLMIWNPWACPSRNWILEFPYGKRRVKEWKFARNKVFNGQFHFIILPDMNQSTCPVFVEIWMPFKHSGWIRAFWSPMACFSNNVSRWREIDSKVLFW